MGALKATHTVRFVGPWTDCNLKWHIPLFVGQRSTDFVVVAVCNVICLALID